MKMVFTLLLFGIVQLSFAQKSMNDICPLKVGSEVPTVSLMDADNNEQSLSSILGSKPAVIIFYRGAWCGYCTQHLSELNDIKDNVESMGYQMFGVTIDQPSKLAESHKVTNNEIKVYSDSSAKAITAFGLDWGLTDETYSKYKNEYKLDLEEWSGEDHHSLPVPAIYIIKDGIVQFQYVNPNYNTRLHSKTLMAILKTM